MRGHLNFTTQGCYSQLFLIYHVHVGSREEVWGKNRNLILVGRPQSSNGSIKDVEDGFGEFDATFHDNTLPPEASRNGVGNKKVLQHALKNFAGFVTRHCTDPIQGTELPPFWCYQWST